jgi:hypothetical protein
MKSGMMMGAGALLCGVLLAGCMSASGPKVRVATATAEQLKAVEDKDQVWYEFQPGDVVPVALGFMGAMEGGSEHPLAFRAKQHFYFVMFKNAPMQTSFDGSSFAGQNSSQSLIAVIPRKDGAGGQLGWMIYMGESGDPKTELKKLIEQEPSPAPAAGQQEASR